MAKSVFTKRYVYCGLANTVFTKRYVYCGLANAVFTSTCRNVRMPFGGGTTVAGALDAGSGVMG